MENEFEILKAEVEHCQKCALGHTRTKAVFGMGNPDAEIMLIGEGPGRDEDLQGLPFVGRAGQLLDKILSACGFTRKEHVYIGNIVKCRPPENRVPTPPERATCMPYLLKQIELIDPKIIILLGSTALQGLLDPGLKISNERGKWRNWNGRLIIPTYHPAALLRNPNLKRPLWEDFKQVVAKYREMVDANHHSDHC
jgi:DNA polymerase